MPVTETFRLPDLGEGLTDAELIRWNVAVGEVIALNQIIAEVETAKAAVELPSPYAGTVVALHAAEGTVLAVGAQLIDVAVESDVPEDPSATPGPTPIPERTPVLVGYGVAAETPSRRAASPSSVGSSSDVAQPAADRPLAAPPIRRAAREHGADLADIVPTGRHGEVTRDDLDRHLQRATRSSAPATGPQPETRTPIQGVRRRTAEAMVSSAFTAPHVTEFVSVDVTPMMDAIATLSGHEPFTDVHLTPLALVAKALLIALRRHPSLNSTWDAESGEIITKHYVNLGIAAATPRGLLVPNIKGAHDLSLRALAAALAELTVAAKAGRTVPADLTGGTITITNIGVFGIDGGTPILNPGEAAIVCFGAVRRRPWEYDGQVSLRQVTTLSLSFDHRLVDGEQGSRFLAAIAGFLADPVTLLAYC